MDDNRFFLRCAFCLLVLGPGCGPDGPTGGPRIETFPITGTVLVDGQPAANLLVTCTPSGQAQVYTTISGFTDDAGHFSIGTYEAGDGAPEGEYQLTFMWGQWNMSGRYGGPDKLNERYTDVTASQHSVVVKNGEAGDVGTIELTTK